MFNRHSQMGPSLPQITRLGCNHRVLRSLKVLPFLVSDELQSNVMVGGALFGMDMGFYQGMALWPLVKFFFSRIYVLWACQ